MEGDDSNDESNKSIKKPNWQFMDGADVSIVKCKRG
jgi:hypothetical protein